MYLLDTDIVIDVLSGVEVIEQFVIELGSSGVSMSAITLMEATHGIMLNGTDLTAIRFEAMQQRMPIIPFGSNEAQECAAMRVKLQQQGKRVRPRALDLMIAATARLHGLVLVTRNVDDYQDVPELALRIPQR